VSKKKCVVVFVVVSNVCFVRYPTSYELYYAALKSEASENMDSLRFLSRRQPLCACINDDLGRDVVESQWAQSVGQLHQALELLLPSQARWEKQAPIVASFDSFVFLGNQPIELAIKLLVVVPSVVYSMGLVVGIVRRVIRK
jgi:hypothetical protein